MLVTGDFGKSSLTGVGDECLTGAAVQSGGAEEVVTTSRNVATKEQRSGADTGGGGAVVGDLIFKARSCYTTWVHWTE